MFENPRRGRQARNFTTNVSKILDLKSSSEQIFFRKLSLGAPDIISLINPLVSDTRDYSRIKQDSLTIYLKTSRCSVSLFSAVSENAFAMTQQLSRIISLLRRHFL